jgi:hypothetical protein
MVHPNDAVIMEIKRLMGKAASLLDYLPFNKVRIEHMADKQRPTTALPYKIHLGQIPNGRQSPINIDILLCVGQLGGPPELRYKKVSRHDEIIGPISAVDAARQVMPAAAFKGMKENGSLDSLKVRAVVRYYFLASKVDVPTMWPVEYVFIRDLTAAYRLVKVYAEAQAKLKPLSAQDAAKISALPEGQPPFGPIILQDMPYNVNNVSAQAQAEDPQARRHMGTVHRGHCASARDNDYLFQEEHKTPQPDAHRAGESNMGQTHARVELSPRDHARRLLNDMGETAPPSPIEVRQDVTPRRRASSNQDLQVPFGPQPQTPVAVQRIRVIETPVSVFTRSSFDTY